MTSQRSVNIRVNSSYILYEGKVGHAHVRRKIQEGAQFHRHETIGRVHKADGQWQP